MKKIIFVLLIFSFLIFAEAVNASSLSNSEKKLFARDDVTIVERVEKTILTTTATDIYGNVLGIYHDEIETNDEERIEVARVETEKNML